MVYNPVKLAWNDPVSQIKTPNFGIKSLRNIVTVLWNNFIEDNKINDISKAEIFKK